MAYKINKLINTLIMDANECSIFYSCRVIVEEEVLKSNVKVEEVLNCMTVEEVLNYLKNIY